MLLSVQVLVCVENTIIVVSLHSLNEFDIDNFFTLNNRKGASVVVVARWTAGEQVE